MKKNILIAVLFVLCGFEFIRLHQLSKEVTYVLPASAKVIEWPEEFSPILQQSGEINSAMTFKMVHDTLQIGFDQN